MSTIITRNSATSGSTPSSLVQGELAINVTDGRLFYGSGSGNTVKQFGVTSSYALNALSSSYALTASFVQNAVSASYALNGGVTQLLAGPNVTLSPTNGLGQVTVSATLSGSTIFNTATGSYGSFYDTTIQTNPVANIARSMSFNSTDITNGVLISGSTSPFNTYIKTTNAGVYNIQFSAQVDKTDGGTDDIVIWLRKNGIDLTDTATTLTLPTNNSKVVAAWNWFVSSAAGDYYQIIWRSDDTDLRLLAEPISVNHPGIPSVILTVNRVDQFLSNTGSFSGSFTGTFTGSLSGTSSYATQALSASFAPSSPAFPFTGSALITGSLGVTGSASILAFTGSSANIFTIRNSANTDNLLQIKGNKVFTLASALVGDGFSTYLSSQTGVTQITAAGNSLALYAAYNINYNAVNQHNIMINGVVRAFMNSSGYLGIGQLTPTARLDVLAQGALSTDIAFRVRNSADSVTLQQFNGDGSWLHRNNANTWYEFFNGTDKIEYRRSGTFEIGTNNDVTSFNFSCNSGNVLLRGGSNIINIVNGNNYHFEENTGILPTSGAGAIVMKNRTAPSTNVVDRFYYYSADRNGVAGKASPHFRTEDGTVVWLGDESRLFNITASRTIISSSQSTASGSSLTVYGSGSTQPVFTVQGSQGELFSVTDSLSGSLFSVNDISGLPILEVFSDNTTLIGDYQDPMLITTKKVVMTNSGSFTVYSLPTASYDTAFYDYSIRSGSNARAGQIMAIQSGSSVNFTETTTTDFGNTTAVSFTVIVSGSNMILTGSAAIGSWTTKCIIRGL